MIKCDVNICAAITRNAAVKEKDGQEFFVFGVKLPVEGRDGKKVYLDISVSNNGGKGMAASYTTNRRVAVKGPMTVRKKNGKVYYNLRSEGDAEITKPSAVDNIEGEMEFIGKIGKNGVVEKVDKNGKPFKTFSAFSSDKNGDNTEFNWVNFMYFEPKDGETFLAAGKYVHVKGTLQLGVYEEKVSLQCVVKEIEEYVFPEK